MDMDIWVRISLSLAKIINGNVYWYINSFIQETPKTRQTLPYQARIVSCRQGWLESLLKVAWKFAGGHCWEVCWICWEVHWIRWEVCWILYWQHKNLTWSFTANQGPVSRSCHFPWPIISHKSGSGLNCLLTLTLRAGSNRVWCSGAGAFTFLKEINKY